MIAGIKIRNAFVSAKSALSRAAGFYAPGPADARPPVVAFSDKVCAPATTQMAL